MSLNSAKAIRDRNYRRSKRHGANWRNILNRWNCLCAICGETAEALHEEWGETKNGEWRFQQRIPLCRKCHQEEHPEIHHLADVRGCYLEDLSREVSECGSYETWCRKYHVEL